MAKVKPELELHDNLPKNGDKLMVKILSEKEFEVEGVVRDVIPGHHHGPVAAAAMVRPDARFTPQITEPDRAARRAAWARAIRQTLIA